MENENLLPPMPPSPEITKGRRLSPIAVCAAIILTASVVCHGFIVGAVIKSVPDEALSRILTSHLLPNYTFAERAVSLEYYEAEPLPGGAEVQDEDIIVRDVSANAENGFAIANTTGYAPDLSALSALPSPIEKRDRLYERYLEGEPLVLVYHTHGTESYRDTNDSGAFRSGDCEKNAVSVGKVMCAALEKAGIPSVHMTEPFDAESYNDAYYNSSSAVAEFLKSHPSVKYVIDLHRDCIMDGDGNYTAPTYTDEKGTSFAQIMFVVGTDEGGSGHREWEKNLTVALHLQSLLHNAHKGLMRPINLRSPSFYQHTSPGAMLLEMGACGNSLAEAKRSAVLFALGLADYVWGRPTGLDPYIIIEELC